MKYIVCKLFNQKGIEGNFNLKKGSSVNSVSGFLCHNNKRICVQTSQNAYDYFSCNDDGNGYQRYDLTRSILNKLAEYKMQGEEEKLSLAYNKIRTDNKLSHFLKDDDDVFTFAFYNAEIDDLLSVKELVFNV